MGVYLSLERGALNHRDLVGTAGPHILVYSEEFEDGRTSNNHMSAGIWIPQPLCNRKMHAGFRAATGNGSYLHIFYNVTVDSERILSILITVAGKNM